MLALFISRESMQPAEEGSNSACKVGAKRPEIRICFALSVLLHYYGSANGMNFDKCRRLGCFLFRVPFIQCTR